MFPIVHNHNHNHNNSNNNNSSSSPSLDDGPSKRKRRPAGTPDPTAEVVALSAGTLMESDRYVCEICGQGFQRDQNLQMHRRRHKVPWKLLKRDAAAEAAASRKRVFVCPEPSCLHHDPAHALGDLVGIKKHFRRKHSNHKQWVCDKCGKGYAVQSDYKAHLKTCGTRGHSCDCGRVFSRVESFIEHQDTCSMSRLRQPEPHENPPMSLRPQPPPSRTASSPGPTLPTAPPPPRPMMFVPVRPPPPQPPTPPSHHHSRANPAAFMTSSLNNNNINTNNNIRSAPFHNLDLELSVGRSDRAVETEPSELREQQLRAAAAEKAYAEEARREARRQMQLAEEEFANAKTIRQRAQAELDRAESLKEQAMVKHMMIMNSSSSSSSAAAPLLSLTCASCRQRFAAATAGEENSLVVSHVSSSVVTDHGGEVEKGRSDDELVGTRSK